jgi:hypothetical protein
VITLLASVCYSASIRSTELIRRGTVLAAFAMALSRLGYSVELWAEAGIRVDGETGAVRTLVKGAHDHLDPAHILYAYAHPSMLRQLCFRASGEWARHGHRTTDWAHTPMDVVHNMPEGTIYLPEVTSMHDYDCATELKKLLDIIGLIEE